MLKKRSITDPFYVVIYRRSSKTAATKQSSAVTVFYINFLECNNLNWKLPWSKWQRKEKLTTLLVL